ncbi:MAG: VCBS repeat-containing protein [Bacteroidales bacterium]|nr:VCBS repeat-containing protein [Bacteroidales bacterium]
MKPRKILLLLGLTLGLATFSWAQRPGDFPDNVDTSDCVSTPPAHAFDIQKKWETPDPGPGGDYAHSASTPLVADMDGDGYPEVLCPWYTYHDHIYGGSNASSRTRPNCWLTTHVCVYDGKTGAYKYKIQTPYYNVDAQPITLADVDKDGKTELFLIGHDKYVYCFRYNANSSANDYKWKSAQPVDEHYILMVADVNNDGIPEVVCGPCIFNAITGTLILKGQMENTGKGFFSPTNSNLDAQYATTWRGYPSHIFALADMDGDNTLELCAGNTIYKMKITNSSGTSGNSWSILRQAESRSDIKEWDGTTIVIDFDNDGDLDVAVLGQNTTATSTSARWNRRYDIYVWDGQTNKVIANTSFEKRLAVSIPFAGDINGDGKAELIFNCNLNGNYQTPDMMRVYAYDPSSQGKMKLLFSQAEAQEFAESSGFTVFDFNQDGADEIIYRGEKFLYILDGRTLGKLSDPIATRSNTSSEYPIVADVDCDGHADILFTERFVWDFTGEYAQTQPSRGKVMCYESKTPGAWGPARKVWNQTPYNVVNINENMTVPQYQFDIAYQFPNGQRPFNAFLRQQTKLNMNGDMFAPAANAYIDSATTLITQYCDSITIDITFGNSGSEALFKPYGLTIYKDEYKGQIVYQRTFTDADLEVKDDRSLHLKYTEADLQQYMPLDKFVITINDIGTGIAEEGGQQMECDTSNNRFAIEFPGFVSTEYGDTVVHMCVGDIYTIGEHIYTEANTYVDTLVNRMGCDSIVTSHVYTHEITVDLGPDQSFCSKEYNPVTLDAGVASVYEWQDGSSERTFTVFETGDYSVIVFDEYGCTDTDEVNVTIIPNPELYITKDAEDFCAAGHVTLIANSTIPDVNYQWNTGETSQSITVSTHGTYTVIADNQGCTGTANITIPICPCEVWVPNAFSPNHDDVNDVFLPQVSNTLASYELMIFDRWGKMVFRTEDVNEPWDGTVKGARSPSNVFTYVIYYTCMSAPDHKERKVGSVTIVR